MTPQGSTARHGRHAVVIGGSLAGLLAARVLWRMLLGRPVTNAKSVPPTLQADSFRS